MAVDNDVDRDGKAPSGDAKPLAQDNNTAADDLQPPATATVRHSSRILSWPLGRCIARLKALVARSYP